MDKISSYQRLKQKAEHYKKGFLSAEVISCVFDALASFQNADLLKWKHARLHRKKEIRKSYDIGTVSEEVRGMIKIIENSDLKLNELVNWRISQIHKIHKMSIWEFIKWKRNKLPLTAL
jgi:hypothetical protein